MPDLERAKRLTRDYWPTGMLTLCEVRPAMRLFVAAFAGKPTGA